MTTPREIHQTFIRTPGLELRSTWQSTQAYKRHSHAQLSIGAILEGNTRCKKTTRPLICSHSCGAVRIELLRSTRSSISNRASPPIRRGM